MSAITEKQRKIQEDFRLLEDSFDQYSYLIELGCLLPAMETGRKTESNLVKGCQSSVWLDIWQDNGKFWFSGDSDTLILKGILYLLSDLFCGQTPADVAAEDITLLKQGAVIGLFEAPRQRGIGNILETLQQAAASMTVQNDSPDSFERKSTHETERE